MAKIIIVDENDRIIGSKEKEEIVQGELYRASGLWITNKKGDVLLAKRVTTKRYDPGKWGPAVAGTVEVGETYASNIIKEAEEELGLRNIKIRKGPMERVAGKQNLFCQWYHTTIDKDLSGFRLQKEEVDELRWVSKEDLDREISDDPEKFIYAMEEIIKLIYPR